MKWSQCAPDTLPMWVAETDFALPGPVRRAVVSAVECGDVGYRPSDEASPLGAAWASWLARSGVTTTADAVFGVPGVVTGLYAAVRAYSAPGDGVVVTPPVYGPFYDAVVELQRDLVEVPLVERVGRPTLDLDGIAAAFEGGARLMLLCHPHNPTGVIFDADQLHELGRIADRFGAVVVSDEVHAPVAYGDVPFVPYAATVDEPERVVTLVSMSKAFSFAGLLCGAAVVGEDVRRAWTDVPRRFRSGPSLLGVIASLAALDPVTRPWLDALVVQLDRNRHRLRDALVDALPGVDIRLPDASYLMWVDCSETTVAADPVAAFDAVGLRVEAGSYFGPAYADHVRINFGTSDQILDAALERIAGLNASSERKEP